LLQQVVSYYAGDPRILSIVVFGSLGRGNWDRYSDLDLDIIIADDITIDTIHELRRHTCSRPGVHIFALVGCG
jgi:predicted nucleotidyltransferase